MKTSPQNMTLFQLKRAIELNKGLINLLEKHPGTPTNPAAKKRLGRYRSALKVCEFTLQRKTDALNSAPIKKGAQSKSYLKTVFAQLIDSRWDEKGWTEFEKLSRQFIQNYNEI